MKLMIVFLGIMLFNIMAVLAISLPIWLVISLIFPPITYKQCLGITILLMIITNAIKK